MLKHRVIPTLLLRGNGLVKTCKFDNARYIGDPINAIRIFNEKEVDELIVLDIDASKTGADPDFAIIEEFATECFMPLCYGGGVRSLKDAKRIFSSGVEKISLQTAVLEDFELVAQIAEEYGSQSVVVSLDIKKVLLRGYRLFSSARGKAVNMDWKEFLDSAVDAGAGEILVTSVDKDGTLSGMDLELIDQAAKNCDVPLIAAGGASSIADIKAAIKSGASAVAAGAFFVYHGPHNAVLITYPNYQTLESELNDL